jgi:hypothetical protein
MLVQYKQKRKREQRERERELRSISGIELGLG